MELRQLRYFTLVAETESITEASRRLFITHAALSNSIKALERELGVSLFDRGGNRIRLNRYGEQFRDQVVPAIVALDEAKQRASSYQDDRERTIDFGYEMPLGNLGKLIKSFQERYPDVIVKSISKYPTLAEYEAKDLFFYSSFKGKRRPEDIRLFTEDMLVILPIGHRLAAQPQVSFADLKGEFFIMGDPGELNDWVEAQCEASGFKPRLSAQAYVWFDTVSLVEEGLGCSFAGGFTWLNGLKHQVVAKKLNNPTAKRSVYAKVSTSHAPSKATYQFLDFIKEYARRNGAIAEQ